MKLVFVASILIALLSALTVVIAINPPETAKPSIKDPTKKPSSLIGRISCKFDGCSPDDDPI